MPLPFSWADLGIAVSQVALAGVLEILKHLHGLRVNGVALNKPQVLWSLDDHSAYVSSTKR